MSGEQGRHDQKGKQKLGWGILLVIAGLITLNGPAWFFSGPGVSLGSPLDDDGASLSEFSRTYPAMVDQVTQNARQLAIWYGAFGIVALMAAVEGLRRGSRWAWKITWILVAVLFAIGLIYLPGGRLGFANVGFLSIGALALVGQLLARRGATSGQTA